LLSTFSSFIKSKLKKITSGLSLDPYHYRPSVVKVGIHLEPIVGKPIELLCNTTLDDLRRISSYKINLTDWQCQWLFYGRQFKFSAASESRAKYHVTLNQDNYTGESISCNHPISTLRLDHDGYYKCQFFWEEVAADIFSIVQSDPLDLSVLCKCLELCIWKYIDPTIFLQMHRLGRRKLPCLQTYVG
jgi:hypothetical protein